MMTGFGDVKYPCIYTAKEIKQIGDYYINIIMEYKYYYNIKSWKIYERFDKNM